MANPSTKLVVSTLHSSIPLSLKTRHEVYSVGRISEMEYMVRQIPVTMGRPPVNLSQLPLGGLHNVQHFAVMGNLLEELTGTGARTARCDLNGFINTFIIRMDDRRPPLITATISDWHENDPMQIVGEVVKVFAGINPQLIPAAFAVTRDFLLRYPLVSAALAAKLFHSLHRKLAPDLDVLTFTIYRNRMMPGEYRFVGLGNPLFPNG